MENKNIPNNSNTNKLKANSTDIIAYKGSVTILYQDKRGKYKTTRKKNKAQMPLFTYITRALQGHLYAELCPKFLNAYDTKSTEASPNTQSLFTQPIRMLTAGVRYKTTELSTPDPVESDCIEYSFLIPYANVIRSGNKSIKSFTLENDRGQICAQIDLEDTEQINVTQSLSNILLYWKLKFSDKNEG